MIKRLFYSTAILLIVSGIPVFANSVSNNLVQDGDRVVYTDSLSTWSTNPLAEDSIIYTKRLYDGDGAYSQYNYEDGSFAFILNTGCEILKNGKLIIVDNNLLKFSKIISEDERLIQIPLTDDEIQELFPQAELLKISTIDSDNKMWLHKPLFKKKTILLVNDTDKYFHKITCKSKNVQDPIFKGLITIPRYGIYRFTHYGQYNGKLIFYIR